ncbi:MAG: cation:proton antiporter [archaeon]
MESGLSGIAFQMSLLLFASLFGFFISFRFKQSGVVGSILAGIILGPSLLGIIPYSEIVAALATIGAIFLLFTVGLDTKLEDLWNPKAGAVAFAGIVFPWLGGYLISLLFGYGGKASFFIGTALTATSVAITVQVLSELGKLGKPEAKIILSAAIIDDVLGLFALAVAEQVAGPGRVSPLILLEKGLIAAIFIAGGLFIGKRFISRKIEELRDWALTRRNYEHVPFILAVFVAFTYSVLAEVAGLSAIIGAFIAGISIGHLESGTHKEGARYFEIIFGNLFFVSLGILVDLRKALNPSLILFVLLLTLVAVLTKFIAGFVTSRTFKFPLKESTIIGMGMVPRGEIAMIIALVGFGAGALNQSAFSAIVLMSLLTTLITPIALIFLYGERQIHQRVKIY